MKSIITAGIFAITVVAQPALAKEVCIHAAGSLKAAMTDIADAFEAATGATVQRQFGPSGLLRERIEQGEFAEDFASANMRHPQRDTPTLKIVQLPEALAVGVDYGLSVLNDASKQADDLAAFILAPDGQQILASYGFGTTK